MSLGMKVLKHTEVELVIFNGEYGYSEGTIPSAKNLIIQPLIAFIVIFGITMLVNSSNVWECFIFGIMIAAFPFTGILLIRIYGGGRQSTYTFDKNLRTLKCSTPAIFPYCPNKITCYSLNEILSVEPLIDNNDDPPPRYWRSIVVSMTGKKLRLYPGDNEQIQEDMTNLIRGFLLN
jgi:hypothetical protein